MITRKRISAMLGAAMLAGAIDAASAQPMDPSIGGWGMGPGMMGGMGPGMMGGMGPGMMGGMGAGMMGGYCPACGMRMGTGGYPGPDLTQDQRAKIAKIEEEARKKQWDLMSKAREEQYKLQELYYADRRDPAAISAQNKKIEELQRQMVESNVEAQSRVDSILTPEQRNKMRSWGRGGMMWGY